MTSRSEWPAGTRLLSPTTESAATPGFTIATLVTDPAQYAAMRASFEAGGFTPETTEYLVIDNTAGAAAQTDAYAGLNRALDAARAPYVILCHQDVRLIADGRAALDARLAELDRDHPAWALAGNAGGSSPGNLAIRITDPHAPDQAFGPFPARVTTLDENFIVVRKAARIGFSRDLDGFHFYGTDICLAADLMGWEAYVIDFHIAHLSPGNKSDSFKDARAAFRAKWSRALRPRWLQTTCALLRVDPSLAWHATAGVIEPAAERLARRMPWSRGFSGSRTTNGVSKLDRPSEASSSTV